MTSQSISKLSSLPTKQQKRFTLEDYLRKEAKSEEKHEFINGNIIKTPCAKGPHNIISANMLAEMKMALRKLENKFFIFSSDQKIYLPSLDEGVYACALAVCEKPMYWDNQTLLLINPMIVVEVLSKSTQKYDRTGKFDKYRTLESFKEYILIRQDACFVEVWYREKPGLWHETTYQNLNGILHLQSVNINIPLQLIYENVEI